jgi:hypothetical protein
MWFEASSPHRAPAVNLIATAALEYEFDERASSRGLGISGAGKNAKQLRASGASIAWPLMAHTQQQPAKPAIGVLHAASAPTGGLRFVGHCPKLEPISP